MSAMPEMYAFAAAAAAQAARIEATSSGACGLREQIQLLIGSGDPIFFCVHRPPKMMPECTAAGRWVRVVGWLCCTRTRQQEETISSKQRC